jgi:transcriptional regulator with XRE-family HTH domain
MDSNKERYRKMSKRLKELRIARGLTQSEVAGDSISRNMLSLIENGQARPSVDTLLYLAAKLEVPAGYFFSADEKEDAYYEKLEAITKLRSAYADGRYKECLDICRDIGSTDDEAAYIRAMSELNLVKDYFERYMFSAAVRHLRYAKDAAHYTVYEKKEILATISFIEIFLTSALSDNIEEELLCPEMYEGSLVPPSFFCYLNCISLFSVDRADDVRALLSTPLMTDSIHIAYLEAKLLITDGHISEAADELAKIYSDPSVGFFTLYHTATDLEYCYGMLEDYRSAYECAKRKLKLIEDFSK